MIKEFLDWEQKVKPEIGHIGFILSQKLSDEPEALINDLRDIESWNARCGLLLAEADSWLDKFSLTAMPPKENRTEKDREVFLDSETAPIRVVRDILERYSDCIKQRLILGESILAYMRQFKEAQIMERNGGRSDGFRNS